MHTDETGYVSVTRHAFAIKLIINCCGLNSTQGIIVDVKNVLIPVIKTLQDSVSH